MSIRRSPGVQAYLGSRLRKWRTENNLFIYELANLTGIAAPSLSTIENNRAHPSANTIAKLLKGTNINIFWLLLNEGEMER